MNTFSLVIYKAEPSGLHFITSFLQVFDMESYTCCHQDKANGGLLAWIETLEVLRSQTLETPVLVWNDLKRLELRKVKHLLQYSLGYCSKFHVFIR